MRACLDRANPPAESRPARRCSGRPATSRRPVPVRARCAGASSLARRTPSRRQSGRHRGRRSEPPGAPGPKRRAQPPAREGPPRGARSAGHGETAAAKDRSRPGCAGARRSAAPSVAAPARPHLARLIFAHLHNLVAIGLWLLLFRRGRRFALPAVALLALAVALCVSGRVLPAVHFGGPGAARFVDEMVFAWPSWMPQRTALGLGLAFVMLQAVHYSVWLAWIPQEDLRGQGTLSFRMSLRSLQRDLGPVWLGLIALVAGAVLAATFVDAHRTRQLYLSLSSFHGYLELAAGAFLFVRGR